MILHKNNASEVPASTSCELGAFFFTDVIYVVLFLYKIELMKKLKLLFLTYCSSIEKNINNSIIKIV